MGSMVANGARTFLRLIFFCSGGAALYFFSSFDIRTRLKSQGTVALWWSMSYNDLLDRWWLAAQHDNALEYSH